MSLTSTKPCVAVMNVELSKNPLTFLALLGRVALRLFVDSTQLVQVLFAVSPFLRRSGMFVVQLF